MKFESQICTTKEQSERLLAFGLNTETADMGLIGDIPIVLPTTWANADPLFDTPAWSLHRLIEMYSEHYVCDHINLKSLTYDTIIESIRLDILTGTFTKEYLEQ